MAPALVGWSSAYLLAGQYSPSMFSPDVLKAGGGGSREDPHRKPRLPAALSLHGYGPVRPG
jgi:hypothetical protein